MRILIGDNMEELAEKINQVLKKNTSMSLYNSVCLDSLLVIIKQEKLEWLRKIAPEKTDPSSADSYEVRCNFEGENDYYNKLFANAEKDLKEENERG
jgi:hypothetical protein